MAGIPGQDVGLRKLTMKKNGMKPAGAGCAANASVRYATTFRGHKGRFCGL